jgi:FSR family fosmidomycin resistance protein-like MFS transporter
MPKPDVDRRLLFVISYHHACNDGALMALVAILPILLEQMDLSYSEIGLLGLGLMITVVVQLIVGRVSDRMFSRYLLEIGAALMAVSFLVIPLVHDFVGLFLAVIFMRIGASFYHPVGISWITRRYEGAYLDTALGVQSGIGNLGVIVSLASSGFIGDHFGWQAPCLIWAGLNMVAVLSGILVPKTSHDDTHRDARPTERTSIMSTVTRIGILAAPLATGGALYQVTTYYGPVNLTTMHGWTVGSADLIFAVWIGIGTVTSYYFGRLSGMFGRMRILKAAYLVSSLSMFALFLVSDWYFVVPVLLLFGALLFLTYPALFALLTDATGERERGTAFGIVFGYQLGGGAAVVYVCGLVADAAADPSFAFLITGILSLISLLGIQFWGSGGRTVSDI